MRKRLISGLLLSVVLLAAAGPRKLPKPGWNLFSKEQDIQLGREAAAQVEQEFTIVQNKELTDYVNRVGMRLVQKGQLDEYPFFFKAVHEDSINAFALPGGPMYVHTGLIKAAENEAQLAGVLAHELSHVVLRHGTNQASKAQGLQIIAMLGGAALGSGSMLGSLAQLGIGIGANSVLLKFSRGAEQQADLLGMHTMAKAGYNPLEMARFFEKLEAEAGRNSKMAEFFSSHPNPGNRVKMVEEELRYLPRSDFKASEGDLAKMKQMLEKLPPAPTKKSGQAAPAGPPPTADRLPQIPTPTRMETFQGGGVVFSYPAGWERIGSDQSNITFAPREGVVQGQNGSAAFGYAILAGVAQPPNGKVDLARDTNAVLKNIASQSTNGQIVGQPERITIDRSPGFVNRISGDSPYKGIKETVVVLTVDRVNALYYFIFVSPETDYKRLESTFQQTAQSIRFR